MYDGKGANGILNNRKVWEDKQFGFCGLICAQGIEKFWSGFDTAHDFAGIVYNKRVVVPDQAQKWQFCIK